MFTQCSKCETVFRLSADVLRAAGGQVRCGRCGDVFNALARLAEEATSFTQGESSLELETRADEILQKIEPVAPVEAAPLQRADIAHLEILDSPDDGFEMEASLEFTLPPGELDRIFIETRPSGALQQLTADLRRSEPAPPPAPLTASAPLAAPPPAARASPAPPPAPVSASTAATSAGPTKTAPARAVPASTSLPGLEVSEDVRQAMLSSFTHAELPDINAPRRDVPFAAWLGAAVVLACLLAVQVIRSNRDWLATHTSFLGGKTSLAATLSAYQLRQWGVTGDPAAKGTLRVRASIMNTAAQLQPFPLLRLSLANRFGARVGEREFEPAEYLGKATARMLAPGERIDATLDIVDPGNEAEGFEIDVCVRGSGGRILCAGDAAAADAAAADAATQAH